MVGAIWGIVVALGRGCALCRFITEDVAVCEIIAVLLWCKIYEPCQGLRCKKGLGAIRFKNV